VIDFITAIARPIHPNENELVIYPDSYDGTRTTEVGGKVQAHSHAAIDVLTPFPMEVLMPVNGHILTAGWDGYGGWSVTVESRGTKSGATYLVYLAHLVAAPTHLVVKSYITAGTLIGVSGMSGGGNADGTRSPVGTVGKFPRHVHVEVKENGTHVNPLEAITRRLNPMSKEYHYSAPTTAPAIVEAPLVLRHRHK